MPNCQFSRSETHTAYPQKSQHSNLPVVFWFLVSCIALQLPVLLWSTLIAVCDVIHMKQSDWSASFKLWVTSHSAFFASPIFKPHGRKIDRQLTRLFFPLHAKNSLDTRLRQGSVWGITLLRSALLDAKSCTFCF